MLNIRFKQAREHAGYTQETAAQAAGVSQTAIFKIEKGETGQPRKINVYASLFGCSPEWLMYGTNAPEWALSENRINETAPTYIADKPKSLSLDDKKLLYCAIIAAKETLENGKAMTNIEYEFSELAKVSVLKFEEFIRNDVNPDDILADINESVSDIDEAITL